MTEYTPLTDDQCDDFRREAGSFNKMVRIIHESGFKTGRDIADRENEELKQSMREIYEVWAGTEEFSPEGCPERDQQKLVKDMVTIAKKFI